MDNLEFVEMSLYDHWKVVWANRQRFPCTTYWEEEEIDPDRIEDNPRYDYHHFAVFSGTELVAVIEYAHVSIAEEDEDDFHYEIEESDIDFLCEESEYSKPHFYLATVEVSTHHHRKGILKKIFKFLISKMKPEEEFFYLAYESIEMKKSAEAMESLYPEVKFLIEPESEMNWSTTTGPFVHEEFTKEEIMSNIHCPGLKWLFYETHFVQ